MIGIVLALLSAIASGLSVVLVRRKLNESNIFNVALIITLIGNIIFWPFVLLSTNLRTVNFEGMLFFALAGAFAPGIARLLYYKGIESVGASANATMFAAYPLYSSILAVLFLNEATSLINWVGMICIVASVVFVERSSNRSNIEDEKIIRRSLLFSVLGALTYAVSMVMRKNGLNIYNEPILGVALGYAFALLIYLLLLFFSDTVRHNLSFEKDFRLFWKAGVGLSLGWILAFYAFSYEKVSVVTPLLSVETLFIIFFAYRYLKELENISLKLSISAILIVFGVVLVTIR